MACLVNFEGRCHPIWPGLSKRRAPPPDRGAQKFKIFKNCSVFDGTFVDRRGFAPRVKRRVTTIFFLAYLVKKKPGRAFRRCQRTISQGFRLSKHRKPLPGHPQWLRAKKEQNTDIVAGKILKPGRLNIIFRLENSTTMPDHIAPRGRGGVLCGSCGGYLT